jgi:AcrR family transcriptional regulator
MSPRPRTVSDQQIFAATARMMGELGPAKLTLARVARAAGLSPATLVQRFGSKRALLLALARSGTQEDAGALVENFRRAHPSPLTALRAFLLCYAQMASSPREYANHLAFLQLDLTDADFLRITQKIVAGHDRAVESLVGEAMAEGELAAADPKSVARLLQSVVTGSLMRWAIFRRGPAARWLARDVDAALERWTPGAAPRL